MRNLFAAIVITPKGTKAPAFIFSTVVRVLAVILGLLLIWAALHLENFVQDSSGKLLCLGTGLFIAIGYTIFQILSTKNFFEKEKK